MKRLQLFIICVLIFQTTIAQKRLLTQLDSNWESQNNYIKEYSTQTFFSSGIGNENIDARNPNEKLLEAAIFFSINRWRVEKKREEYTFNDKLDGIASSYINYYNKYRFESNNDNYYKLRRTLGKVPKYLDLDFTFMEGYTQNPFLIDYKRGSFYFDDENNESKYNLYRGEKNNIDTLYPAEPINSITYNEFANRTLKKWLTNKSATFLRSKAYELITIKVKKISNGKIRKKIPYASVIFLLGGYRNKFLLEKEDNDSE